MSRAELQGKRVLIVDGDFERRESLADAAADAGAEVARAAGFKEALRLIASAEQRGEDFHAVAAPALLPDGRQGADLAMRVASLFGEEAPKVVVLENALLGGPDEEDALRHLAGA
ncbi:hypothetical protein [Desulfohalovibrio reitneri]|uniref:hypothetical protein n=1 Tax=Desulfohalovibrio reitneri TaxID=1307759 RepID=UPI0004A7322A|nr:hypothetical protein [Desulfohalovibrio reitneri]